MTDTLLAVDDLVAGYGDSIILEGVSIELAVRGSLALLGRNGVGKTNLIASLLGLTCIHRGTIVLAGADVTGWRPYARAHVGMGWVPQERDIFPSLTVKENLTVVARPGHGRWIACIGCFRGWTSAAAIWATSSPAASSRCLRSDAR